MISVKFIFDSVQDLAKKDNSGYTSSEEFNRHLAKVQDILMRYYYLLFEEKQIIVDSLNPFIKELRLQIGDKGIVQFPEDYRHRLEVGNLEITKPDCGEVYPNITPRPCPHLAANEVMETLASPVRKPSRRRRVYYHTFVNNYIQLYPDDLTGYIHFKYLIDPPVATYATTFDTVNRIQVFDDTNSVDLIWNPQDRDNIVDLLLLFRGIAIRESALIQWVQQKGIIEKQIL